MAGEVAIYNPKFLGARPTHLTTAFGDAGNLVPMSVRIPTLSFQGKVFKIEADGEEHRLVKEVDGDMIPLPSIPVIILGYSQKRSRSYYADAFDPNNIKPPTCWSSDGVTPDDQVADKQSAKCASCPQSVVGSKITDNNKPSVACTERRNIAVCPAKGLTKFPPLRLNISATSDYDGRSKHLDAKGQFAFSNYIDHIRGNGVKLSYDIITKISFDQSPGITYPKLLFQPLDWVDQKSAVEVKRLLESGLVEPIIGSTDGPVGTSDQAKPQTTSSSKPNVTTTAAAGPTPEQKAEAKRVAAAATKKAKDDAAALAAAQAAEAEAAKKAKVGDVAMDLGSDDDTIVAADVGSVNGADLGGDVGDVDPKNPPGSNATDDEISSIMDQWGSD